MITKIKQVKGWITRRIRFQALSTRQRALLALSSIFFVIGISWSIYWLIWGRFNLYTDDAYINGNIIQLMPQVAGIVTAIYTDDTQLATQGQVLLKLDPTDKQIALQRAEASLGLAIRQVFEASEKRSEAEATYQLRQADLEKAEADVKRRKGLIHSHAISNEEWHHYQTNLAIMQARYQVAQHALGAAKIAIGDTPLYDHPMIKQAKENLKQAYLNLERTNIIAPVTGMVAKRQIQVGQQVGLNTLILGIVPLNQVWVDANYKESQLNRIRAGQFVTLSADAYPERTYHGIVIGLSPGTGSAFALLPAQNATGNWIKIVQRLPVRIGLDAKELEKHPLQIGLSMHVTVHTSKNYITKKMIAPRYLTDIYKDQLGQANKRIEAITEAIWEANERVNANKNKGIES